MRHLQLINECLWPLGFSATYERLLRAIGTEEFESVVHSSVNGVTEGVRRIYLFESSGPDESELQYSSYEPCLEEFLPLYLEKYQRADPYHEACRALPKASGGLALLRLQSQDVLPAGFRRHFFEDTGIAERLSVVQRGENSWRVMNVSKHRNHGRFSESEITSIIALAGVLLPMLPLNSSRRSGRSGSPLTLEQYEARFARRFPSLTRREYQVCARAAIGMTVEGTALDLGIGKTSVLTYRKRAYQRLQISSSYELSALVMN
jgi:DNA-binding CsgD family transcriptional regulator